MNVLKYNSKSEKWNIKHVISYFSNLKILWSNNDLRLYRKTPWQRYDSFNCIIILHQILNMDTCRYQQFQYKDCINKQYCINFVHQLIYQFGCMEYNSNFCIFISQMNIIDISVLTYMYRTLNLYFTNEYKWYNMYHCVLL